MLSSGGLTASLGIFADAPGCRQLVTIIRDHRRSGPRGSSFNALDKEKVLEKESVHFGFPFQVPDGVMRIDIPWAVIQPDVDQLPGACKNYLTVGRWVDVSNASAGHHLGHARCAAGGSRRHSCRRGRTPSSARAWIQQLGPTQTLFSYVMNNYWETNYKASQEGMTTFRYSLLPHGPYDQAAAARFGIERSQPLVAAARPTRRAGNWQPC